KRPVKFDRKAKIGRRAPLPIDVDRDGTFEFIDGGFGSPLLELIAADGARIWEFDQRSFTDNPVSEADVSVIKGGDLDGDGKMEIVIEFNHRNIIAINHDGSIRWRKPALQSWGLELLDIDGDGKSEVIHLDQNKAVIRDGAGVPLQHTPFSFGSLAMDLVWNLPTQDPHLVGLQGDQVHRIDPLSLAKKFPQLRAPFPKTANANQIAIREVIPVNLGGSVYYAAHYIHPYEYDLAYLGVFSANGNMIYEETFNRRLLELVAVDDLNRQDGTQCLLVSCKNRVTEYRIAP
ncbi:MAG: VCBS repeat-containing protein, partial [Verrucomicrobiota bacterium]